jgi:hypothetical protein
MQGSEAWTWLKLGVVSASNASKAVAKKGTDTRNTYMAELVAQVGTGLLGEELSSKYVEWGHAHEDAARSSYEFAQDAQIIELPFVFKDDAHRVGCSPDGLVEIHDKIDRGCEIKSPFNSVHYVKFLTEDKLKSEYDWQIQFSMWVLKADIWDAVQYDPRMKSKPLHIVTIKRDEEKMKAFDDLIPAFIHDMDEMLKRAGLAWGDQWKRLSAAQTSEWGIL